MPLEIERTNLLLWWQLQRHTQQEVHSDLDEVVSGQVLAYIEGRSKPTLTYAYTGTYVSREHAGVETVDFRVVSH